jgi:hypothetical protein
MIKTGVGPLQPKKHILQNEPIENMKTKTQIWSHQSPTLKKKKKGYNHP